MRVIFLLCRMYCKENCRVVKKRSNKTNGRVGVIQDLKSAFACLFSWQDIDEHYVIKLFGAKICKKHKYNVDLKPLTKLGITQEKRSPRLIVSLTTFPARINLVHKTITTLLQQTLKPDMVILWLAEEQFPNRELPASLTDLQQFGLSIKWCEDIKSYKKLIPTLREFPDDIIVTADDDILYPKNWLESLYDLHKKYPNCVCANRAFMVKKRANAFYITSRNYCYNSSYLPRFRNEFMTGYGSLFPPNALDKRVLDSEIFMREIPTNDDIWFWGMAVLNGTKIAVNPKGYQLKLIEDKAAQEFCLKNLNRNDTTVGTSGRDGVNKMCKLFPKIEENLESRG